MKLGFYLFMERIIDYAGLFPPARLPMAEAVRNYGLYRKDVHSWLLARFVCPANKIDSFLKEARELLTVGEPVPLSLLASAGETPARFLENLRADIEKLTAALAKHRRNLTAEFFEAKLPGSLLQQAGISEMGDLLNEATQMLNRAGLNNLCLFVEANFSGNWREQTTRTLECIQQHNQRIQAQAGEEKIALGYKLRCGGESADTYPTVEQVSFVLHQCILRDIPFKATAGLHHPIRHFNRDVQVTMHGFVNLFSAALLGYTHRLPQEEIQRIVGDEEPENFQFSDDGLKWGIYEVPNARIKWLREERFFSFGSCSVEEPVEDLKQLGWLG